MIKLSDEVGVDRWKNGRINAVDLAAATPNFFASHELDYISKRLPYTGENHGKAALIWANRVGNRDEMASVVKEKGSPEDRVDFAYFMSSYENQMKETIDSAAGALFWANRFPGDREEMKKYIGGGEWAFRWAKQIGDIDEMESRIDHSYWQRKFDKEIREDESVSFITR